jgi:hypothetical protein
MSDLRDELRLAIYNGLQEGERAIELTERVLKVLADRNGPPEPPSGFMPSSIAALKPGDPITIDWGNGRVERGMVGDVVSPNKPTA